MSLVTAGAIFNNVEFYGTVFFMWYFYMAVCSYYDSSSFYAKLCVSFMLRHLSVKGHMV